MNDLLPLLNDAIECSCKECTSACHRKPGWFLPQEIKPAADLLGLTEEEFFKRYLSVDYYGNPDNFLYVLSPATDKSQPGDLFPFDPSGQCIFLKDEKCSIHAAKPYECKVYDHRNLVSIDIHKKVAEAWIEYKDKIVQLLGREPKVASFEDLPIEEQNARLIELAKQLPLPEQIKFLSEIAEAKLKFLSEIAKGSNG